MPKKKPPADEPVWVIYEGKRPPPGVPYIDGTLDLIPDDAPWLEWKDLADVVVPDDFMPKGG